MLAAVTGTAARERTGRGCSAAKRPERVFTYVTTAESESPRRNIFQSGIDVPGRPFRIAVTRSASVGILPDSVDRTLNLPDVRSRGLGYKMDAAGPLPFPSPPWQWAHLAR